MIKAELPQEIVTTKQRLEDIKARADIRYGSKNIDRNWYYMTHKIKGQNKSYTVKGKSFKEVVDRTYVLCMTAK